MAEEWVSVELDGRSVLMRVTGAEQLPAVPGQGKYSDTGKVADRMARGVDGLDDLIRGVAGAMRRATAALEPQQVSVSFGIELAAKPGKVISLLAEAEGKAALTVTLTWQNDKEQGEGAQG
ncbi:CU044_2847 family protein [Streptomyces sp. NPDC089919]|uniref:CU044_2847 family protein n=1 Tax=Streptomyces sp. NPDC089919 TaxID=3155188 RepID=UPI003436A177